MRTVRDVLFDNTRIDEHAIAISSDEEELTFGQLQAQVASVASALAGEGVARGDRVAVVAENTADSLIAYYAITSIGAIYVPLSWRLHASEHLTLMEDSSPVALICPQSYEETIDAAGDLPSLRFVAVSGDDERTTTSFEQWKHASGRLPSSGPEPDDGALIVYTSGTTGDPKGVLLNHRNVVADLQAVMDYIEPVPGDVEIHVTPLYHQSAIFSHVHLAAGARVHLLRKFEPDSTLAAVERFRGTYVFVAPTMLYDLLDCPTRSDYDLTSLRCVAYGAAPIAGARLHEALAAFGPVLVQTYGCTESTSHASYLSPEGHLVAEGSIGRGMNHLDLDIVFDDGSSCPPGQVGEIVLRGPSVMAGYWRQPEATADAIKDGWLHTGDLARYDEDGYVYIVDRKKDLVISGGVNIYPRDIENVIARHPEVAEVAVVGVPDARWGEALAAVIRPRSDAGIDVTQIENYCRDNLGGFQVPKRIVLVDELPKNPAGKVLKREIPPLLEEWGIEEQSDG